MNSKHATQMVKLLLAVLTLVLFNTKSLCNQEISEPAAPKIKSPAEKRTIWFDLDIQNGILLLEPIRAQLSAITLKKLWGTAEAPQGVAADVRNLAKYIQALDPELNLVISPGTETIEIQDLKLRSVHIGQLMIALEHATGGRIRAFPFDGPKNWAIQSKPSQHTERSVEVFNVSGYIRHLKLEDRDPKERTRLIQSELENVQVIIEDTIRRLSKSPDSTPAEFKFHEGTQLFIVIGSPRALNVARKVINALPGQPPPPGQPALLDVPIPGDK